MRKTTATKHKRNRARRLKRRAVQSARIAPSPDLEREREENAAWQHSRVLLAMDTRRKAKGSKPTFANATPGRAPRQRPIQSFNGLEGCHDHTINPLDRQHRFVR